VPVALILIGQLSVRVAYPLGALNIAHLPHVPLIILAFDFATLMYVVALFRFRMFDLVPVARETIIDLMPDAMLVVDSRGRIADLNAAAARLFEVSRPKALGRLVTEVLERFPGIAERSLSEPAESDAIELAPDAGRRWTQVSTRKLTDWQGAQIGRLVLLHDVTELRHAEERLLEHERALAVSQVREQMARDLHDSVSQVLGYVSMQADATYKLLSDARHDEAGRQLQRLAGVAREAHADVRGYIQELHEASSEQRPLADALRRETERFTRNYGIDVRLTVEPRPDGFALAPERQTRLLRMVQEALTNARRHGLAPHIRIDVRAHDSVGEIVIEDDGLGFDPAALTAAPGDRYGLRFMRERAFELDAELDIDSAPGRGTRVGIRVPLRVDMEDGPVRDRSAMVGQRVERR
jgi:PAS domain S-box-containing protein